MSMHKCVSTDVSLLALTLLDHKRVLSRQVSITDVYIAISPSLKFEILINAESYLKTEAVLSIRSYQFKSHDRRMIFSLRDNLMIIRL